MESKARIFRFTRIFVEMNFVPIMSFQESFHKMDDMLRDPVYAKAVLGILSGPMFFGVMPRPCE